MEHTLPKGFHFTPSDEELLIYYLGNLERGLPLPSNAVIVRDLYDRNKSPWEIFNSDDDPWEKKTATAQEKHVYVITELDKASDNRIRRTVGCGSWHESGGTEVYDNNRCIGSKKTYAFEITSNDCLGMNNNGHWIMNELTASNSLTGGKCVICKISRDDSKPTKIAPPSRRNNNNVKSSSKGQGTKKRKNKKTGNNDDDDDDCVVVVTEAVGDGSSRKKMCRGQEKRLLSSNNQCCGEQQQYNLQLCLGTIQEVVHSLDEQQPPSLDHESADFDVEVVHSVGDDWHRERMCHGHEEVEQQNDQQLSLVINEQQPMSFESTDIDVEVVHSVGDDSRRKRMCYGHEEVEQQMDNQQQCLVVKEQQPRTRESIDHYYQRLLTAPSCEVKELIGDGFQNQNTSMAPNNGFDGLLGDGVENEDTWFSYGELLGDQGQQQPMQEQDNYNYNPVISIWS